MSPRDGVYPTKMRIALAYTIVIGGKGSRFDVFDGFVFISDFWIKNKRDGLISVLNKENWYIFLMENHELFWPPSANGTYGRAERKLTIREPSEADPPLAPACNRARLKLCKPTAFAAEGVS